MTTVETPSEFRADARVIAHLRDICTRPIDLAELEELAVAGKVGALLDDCDAWRTLRSEMLTKWQAHDYVVIRGLPVREDGASLLLAATAIQGRFKTYRDGKVVKTFRMSPWTKDLSHTSRGGEFHTDLNTEPDPPAITCIQCLTPDPGAPRYGVNRVAKLTDVLAYLRASGLHETLDFLCETPVAAVNDRADSSRMGTIVQDDRIQFHPETIRAACRRSASTLGGVDEHLAAVHAAGLAVSLPFWLGPGDVLFISNHRTLHYRGECSVVFTEYPLDYQARTIHLLHKVDEPR
jgi:Taurine catabolism dioxygenase TauD, TfdA family